MTSLCLCFQVHQPRRFRWFWPNSGYFNDSVNEEIFKKVSKRCYRPATQMMLGLLKANEGRFKVTYSLSGTFLDQCERYDPGVLDLFKKMVDTGYVELLDETYYHSLASLFEDKREFLEEVKMHREAMERHFGCRPRSFRNTELIYSNEIAAMAEGMGYKAILMEGAERVLGWRSPNYLYRAKGGDIRVLARNYRLSDDIAFRFSSHNWECFPLTADKWAKWAKESDGDTVNVVIDYETIGEHQWEETGIFWFFKALPREILKGRMDFETVTGTANKYSPMDEVDVPEPISWADLERDTSAWLGNDMQKRCFQEVMLLEPYIKHTGDAELLEEWRNMLTSDHIYYICTKWLADGDVHSYFSHHRSPFDAGVNYAAILYDLKAKVFERLKILKE